MIIFTLFIFHISQWLRARYLSIAKKIAKNGNKRPLKAYIKSKTKSRNDVGPLKVGNSFISNNSEMATLLNEQLLHRGVLQQHHKVSNPATVTTASTVSNSPLQQPR